MVEGCADWGLLVKRFLKTFLKTFTIIFIISFLVLSGVVFGSLYGYIDNLQGLDIKNLKMNFTSVVYYINPETGEPAEMERLYETENRIWAEFNDTPEYLKKAFVAIEDERFEKHMGFDIKRTGGAALKVITTGKFSFGGSTITQQLIKNLTGDEDVSISRKIREIYRAFMLERELSKDEILELYMNTIYLGQRCYGVQTAANVYFGKNVKELTLAESASIAGITQFPSRYDPIVNPQNNKEKQEIVLKKMLELGYISEAEHDGAVSEELIFKNGGASEADSTQSYFVDTVIDEVLGDLQKELGYSKPVANKMLFSGGLKIYSTADIGVQNAMNEVFADDKNFPNIKGEVKPEAAMVVIDPYTGGIKGIIGGRGEKTANRTLNRATQALRQPGSAIKPVSVYAPAIEYGYVNAATMVNDEPITIGGWSPRNANGKFSGKTTVRRAVEQSLNVPAVNVLDKITVDTSYKFLTGNLGITTLVNSEKRGDKVYSDKNLSSLALGGLTDGVCVMELTAAYAPFANRGIYVPPHSYTRVLDRNGAVILEKKAKPLTAMSEQTAFIMTKLLVGVVENGIGSGARFSGAIETAGKTGTTSENRDRWFVGFTPYYVGGAWFGFDQPKSLAGLSQNPAATLWKAVMTQVHKGKSAKTFDMPSGVYKTGVCIDSGKQAGELCTKDYRGSRVRYEFFKKGSGPSGTCDVHIPISICGESGQLAGEHCPVDGVSEASAPKGDMPEVCELHGGAGPPEDGEPETDTPAVEDEPALEGV